MPNITATQILVDGDKNVVVLCTGVLDTSNVSVTTVINDALLVPATNDLLINRLWWSVQGGLQVLLWWDATTDDLFAALTGAHDVSYSCFGGLKNPRSAGWNGNVVLSTLGYTSGTVAYTVGIEASKRSIV